MRRIVAAIVAALALLAVSARAADIDPAVVGTWERTVTTPFGSAKSIWDIRADGTYASRSEGQGGAPAQSGTVTFSGGFWTLKSAGGGFFGNVQDKGTYRLDGPNTIEAIGMLGSVTWQRAGTVREAKAPPELPPEPPPKPVPVTYRQIGKQNVPDNLVPLLAYAQARARAWRKDAVLTSLRTKADSDGSTLDLEFDFFAPGDGRAATWPAGQAPDSPIQEYAVEKIPGGRLPPRFPDLVGALAAARDQGLGPVAGGKLSTFGLGDGRRVVAWEFLDQGGATHFVDGFTGASISGGPKDSTAAASWGSNADSFERLAQAQLRGTTPRPMGWMPPFGTSCSTGAACRALQDRNLDAAIRLDAGLASEADVAKYDR